VVPRGVGRGAGLLSRSVAQLRESAWLEGAICRVALKTEAGPVWNAAPLRGVQRITQCESSRERYGFFSVGFGPLKEAERTRSGRRPQSEAGQSITAAPGRAFEYARARE
jgi:hypothetical protein